MVQNQSRAQGSAERKALSFLTGRIYTKVRASLAKLCYSHHVNILSVLVKRWSTLLESLLKTLNLFSSSWRITNLSLNKVNPTKQNKTKILSQNFIGFASCPQNMIDLPTIVLPDLTSLATNIYNNTVLKYKLLCLNSL